MLRPVFAASILVLAACASAPVARDVQRTAVVEGAEFGETWDTVVDVFAERIWAIDSIERASGLITTDWMLVGEAAEDYMDCGSAGFLKAHRDHEVRFNVLVREGGPGAELTVNTAMRATSWDTVNGMPREVVQCVSTGVLEREIHDEVMSRATSGTRG